MQKRGMQSQQRHRAPADDVPEGFDPTVSRAENRHRFTSRAHRKGSDEARKKGLEGEERLAFARTFSQKASQEFELLWPKPTPQTEVEPKPKNSVAKKRKNKAQKVTSKKHKKKNHEASKETTPEELETDGMQNSKGVDID